MGRHANRNQNATTEEPVVKEDSTPVVAEETAEQTPEPETEKTVEETEETTEEKLETPEAEKPAETTEENFETPKPEVPVAKETEEKQKTVVVTCDKLYIRPEPNKKADIGVLVKGTKLIVNKTDAKLPEGWLYVTVEDKPSVVGYVVAEYVK